MELNSANQPIRWGRRIGTGIVGHGFKQVEEFVFDYTLYPAAIAFLGTVVGGLVMTVFSAVMCYLYLLFYDWSKRDWFGFELLKEARDGEGGQGLIERLVRKIAKKGGWLAFLSLSVYMDPFMTTVYMRSGAEKYDGLSSRDWKIFWGSVLVANLAWTGIVSSGLALIKTALRWFGYEL